MALWDEPNIECAEICFWPLTASTISEVKNDHAHVMTQDIRNKFIEVNFFVGCMVSQPNCLLQDLTTMSFINKILIRFQKYFDQIFHGQTRLRVHQFLVAHGPWELQLN